MCMLDEIIKSWESRIVASISLSNGSRFLKHLLLRPNIVKIKTVPSTQDGSNTEMAVKVCFYVYNKFVFICQQFFLHEKALSGKQEVSWGSDNRMINLSNLR